jgi:predicted amidohydrolase
MVTHQFHRLTVHVYYLSPDSTTDRPVLGAIVGTTGTLVVDAGNSPAHAQVLLDCLYA